MAFLPGGGRWHGLSAGSETEQTTSRGQDAAVGDGRTTDPADWSYDDTSWSQCRHVARSLVGTPNYIAPEVLSQSGACSMLKLPLVGFVNPPPIGERERSIEMSVSVSLCVCLSAITSSELHQFLCMLPMAVARSSSGRTVLRYVLQVLRMTSYLLISKGCSTSPPG